MENIEFVISGGPKFYAYIVRKPNGDRKEVCKVKGITLNYNNSQHINYTVFRDLITGREEVPIEISYDVLRRTAFHRVITMKAKKKTSICSTKRCCKDIYKTVPFGSNDV